LRQLSGAGIGPCRRFCPQALCSSGGRPVYLEREDRRLPRVLALVSWGGPRAVARALIEAAWPHAPDTIGWATLILQRQWMLLIGALLGAIGRYRPSRSSSVHSSGVGVLGGYTTFSTHIVEVQHHRARQGGVGLGYLALQLGTGVIAVAAGACLSTGGPSDDAALGGNSARPSAHRLALPSRPVAQRRTDVSVGTSRSTSRARSYWPFCWDCTSVKRCHRSSGWDLPER